MKEASKTRAQEFKASYYKAFFKSAVELQILDESVRAGIEEFEQLSRAGSFDGPYVNSLVLKMKGTEYCLQKVMSTPGADFLLTRARDGLRQRLADERAIAQLTALKSGLDNCSTQLRDIKAKVQSSEFTAIRRAGLACCRIY